MIRTYRGFGVTVAADLDLPNFAPGAGEPDVTITGRGVAAVPDSAPAGVVLSELRTGDGALSAITARADDGRVTLRLNGAAEFTLDGSVITYLRDPSASVALVKVFVTGMCLATWLQLAGRDILHASAVHVPALDGALAFVGYSGMGKSTMATVMSRAGCALMADDILRLDREADGYLCHRGVVETRLRPKAADLAATFEHVNDTGDQRLAVRLPVHDAELAPLRAIVVPGPDPAADKVELTRVTGAQALFTVMAMPRLVNWHDSQRPTAALDFLGGLVERVPVFTSRLPWGPPFAPDLADQLLDSLGRELA